MFLNHAFDTVMFYLRDSFHFIKTKKIGKKTSIIILKSLF